MKVNLSLKSKILKSWTDQGHQNAEHDLNASHEICKQEESRREDASHRNAQIPIQLAIDNL